MSRLASRAARIKLAHSLGVAAEELDYLDGVPAAQINRVRAAVLEQVFDEERRWFRRLARLVSWLPAMLLGAVGRRLFPPLLLARMVGELRAHKAVAIARRMPVGLIADACPDLDPRRSPDLIRLLPEPMIVAVALELIGRRDYVTLSQFVDFLADGTIKAVIDAVEDEEHLVRIAFFLESSNRLDHLVRMLAQERRRRAILLVLDELRDLLLEVMALVVHVSYALKRELGELAAAQDDEVLNRIIRTTQEHALWADLLPVVATLSETTQRRVVNLALLKDDPAILTSILEAADRHRLWLTVLPLVAMLDAPMREAVARFGAVLPWEAKTRISDAALIGEHWQALFDIVARMPAAAQIESCRVVVRYGEVDPELLARLTTLAQDYGFGHFMREQCA